MSKAKKINIEIHIAKPNNVDITESKPKSTKSRNQARVPSLGENNGLQVIGNKLDLINSAEKIQLKVDPFGQTNTSLMNKHTHSGAGDS